MPAPRLTAAQRRHMIEAAAEAERQAAVGGHVLTWGSTFSTVRREASGDTRANDAYCFVCHKLRVIIWAEFPEIEWGYGRPDETCVPR